MKTFKVCLILFLFVNENAFCLSLHKISDFTGRWINTQFLDFQKSGANKNVLFSITPQYILIDSTGDCTLFIRSEQKSRIGRPVRERTYGNIKEVTYRKTLEFYLTEIGGTKDLLVLSGKDFVGTIIFKRQ